MFSIKATIKKFLAKEQKPENATDPELLKNAVLVLRAINHPLRLQTLKLLDHYGSMTITEVYQKLCLEQSEASRHLAILQQLNIVTTQKKGKNILYAVNYQRIEEVRQISSQR